MVDINRECVAYSSNSKYAIWINIFTGDQVTSTISISVSNVGQEDDLWTKIVYC